MTDHRDVPAPRDGADGGPAEALEAEAVARGRAVAKRAFWGMMTVAALLIAAGVALDRLFVVGVLLVGLSFPMLKVLREYRRPDEFARARYWDTVASVLERHEEASGPDAPAGESDAERRLRIRKEMERVRRLDAGRKSGGGNVWPTVLLTLAAAVAGVLYLTLGHNTTAAVAWFCMAGFAGGLGWLRQAMGKKERRALSLLEEELKELGEERPPSKP